jgi:hypothetical protein
MLDGCGELVGAESETPATPPLIGVQAQVNGGRPIGRSESLALLALKKV